MMRHLPGLFAVLVLLLSGCAPRGTRPPLATPDQFPADFPLADYERAAGRGEPVYRIDPTASEIRVLVYRGGALARLGHNHVIVSRNVHGYILAGPFPEGQRADLAIPVSRLIVDDPIARQEAGEGFEYALEPRAIESTTANMLGEAVLDAQRYPFITAHARPRTALGPATLPVHVEIQIHGVTRGFDLTAHTERSSDGLLVSGTMELRQSDFGISPFSILGGALRVQDRVVVHFRLLAKPYPDSANRQPHRHP